MGIISGAGVTAFFLRPPRLLAPEVLAVAFLRLVARFRVLAFFRPLVAFAAGAAAFLRPPALLRVPAFFRPVVVFLAVAFLRPRVVAFLRVPAFLRVVAFFLLVAFFRAVVLRPVAFLRVVAFFLPVAFFRAVVFFLPVAFFLVPAALVAVRLREVAFFRVPAFFALTVLFPAAFLIAAALRRPVARPLFVLLLGAAFLGLAVLVEDFVFVRDAPDVSSVIKASLSTLIQTDPSTPLTSIMVSPSACFRRTPETMSFALRSLAARTTTSVPCSKTNRTDAILFILHAYSDSRAVSRLEEPH